MGAQAPWVLLLAAVLRSPEGEALLDEQAEACGLQVHTLAPEAPKRARLVSTLRGHGITGRRGRGGGKAHPLWCWDPTCHGSPLSPLGKAKCKPAGLPPSSGTSTGQDDHTPHFPSSRLLKSTPEKDHEGEEGEVVREGGAGGERGRETRALTVQ